MVKHQMYILFFCILSCVKNVLMINQAGTGEDFNNLKTEQITLSQNDGETCKSGDQYCNYRHQDESHDDQRLVRLNGVKVGHIQEINIDGGQTHKLVTRSMRPLLFEIADFLSEDECDHIINLAKNEGLTESMTIDNKVEDNTDNASNTNNNSTDDETQDETYQCKQMIAEGDLDKGGTLSSEELAFYLENTSSFFLKGKDVAIMLQELNFDKDGDGELSFEECLKGNDSALEDYLDKLEDTHPVYRSRISQQAWLPVDENGDAVLLRLRNRVKRLTKLPNRMIEESEHLQVVRYSVGGHFHAHYDSTEKNNMPCCMFLGNNSVTDKCNLCRYMTILYYLNNVTQGGETAFPIADNATFDEDEYERKGLSNLSRRCYQSNIAVLPRKGTALLWYNHGVDPDTGKMGSMDIFSLHGGCDVQEGVKWIANNWINDFM